MRTLRLTITALALAGALPARAADPDLARELKALQERVRQLEQAQQQQQGMSPEQQQELDRVVVKTEALEDAREESGAKGLKVSAWADPSYVYNFAKRRGTFQFIVPATTEGYAYDSSYFGTVSLDLQKETESGVRLHLNLVPKRGTGDFNEGSIVNEASIWIPVGGKTFFVGQLPDWSGYEYQSPVLNLLVTHNLLFDFTLPYFYTGAGVQLALGRTDLKVMVANYNTSLRQLGEQVPALVFRGDYSPKGTDYWGFGFAGGVGVKSNARAFLDTGFGFDEDSGLPVDAEGNLISTRDTFFATGELDCWRSRGKLTLNGQVSYGFQRDAAITASAEGKLRDAQWFGASALVAYKLTPLLQGVLRGDFIYNEQNGGGLLDWVEADAANGVGPDQEGGDPERGASKYAVTVGVNYTYNPNVILKLEYRFDGATRNVFGNEDVLAGGSEPDYSKHNSLLATEVVFSY